MARINRATANDHALVTKDEDLASLPELVSFVGLDRSSAEFGNKSEVVLDDIGTYLHGTGSQKFESLIAFFTELDASRARLARILGMTETGLQEWLESDAVQQFFQEFVQDFLRYHPSTDDASYEAVANLFGAHVVLFFTSYNIGQSPEKHDWADHKHWTRFVTQLCAYSVTHDTMWTTPKTEDLEHWILEAYETVSYLKQEWAFRHA
ncbi:hypothetical protein F4780DRAFT_780997 [Xylariomycetidae sp. FL0641]|nr:hypothetical protein F4780DRAFT_780997 [Xylariomycetidae sp. FL0641]